MKSLFTITLFALGLISCKKNEIPDPDPIVPDLTAYNLEFEVYCDECDAYWQIDTTSVLFHNVDTLIFDTIVYGSHYIFSGFIDDNPKLADYYASIKVDGLLVDDTLISNLDTVSYLSGYAGIYWTE